ncbi:hypothetical protein FBUS_02419, partial [Fasciolopsis buskii]
ILPTEVAPEQHHSPFPVPIKPDLPHPSVDLQAPSDRKISASSTSLKCQTEVKTNPDCEFGRRILPKRQAQLNAKPIVDLSLSHLLDISSERLPCKPRTKRRRRLIRTDDDDEEEEEEEEGVIDNKHAKSVKHTTKVKLGPKPSNISNKAHGIQEHQRPQQLVEGQSPSAARVVEVLLPKPGRVAYRVDSKHRIPANSCHLSHSSKAERDGEFTRPKNVFDLSANQTVNMSVLPPTLNDLRQREQAKRDAQNVEAQKPADTENAKCPPDIISPHITVVLSPVKPKSEHNSDGPELRGVLTERNLDPPARSFPRRRLICDDDELEVARTVSNGTTSHGSSGTSTVKHPNGARQSSRSKACLLIAAITCGIAAFNNNHSSNLSGVSVFGRAYRHTDYDNNQRNSRDALQIFGDSLGFVLLIL